MQRYKLNAAEFADTLNVQRSNISHLLTGRNKPSVDFLSKLITTFPDISIKWLITGIGPHNLEQQNVPNQSAKELKNIPLSSLAGETSVTLSPIKEKESEISTRKVTKVILIYDDNTFDVY